MENTVFGVRLCPRLGQSAGWPCCRAKAPRDPATEARPSLSDCEALPARSKCQQMLRATAWELVVAGDGEPQGHRLVWVCLCVWLAIGHPGAKSQPSSVFPLPQATWAYPYANGHQRELCPFLPHFWSSLRTRLTFPLTSVTSKTHQTGSYPVNGTVARQAKGSLAHDRGAAQSQPLPSGLPAKDHKDLGSLQCPTHTGHLVKTAFSDLEPRIHVCRQLCLAFGGHLERSQNVLVLRVQGGKPTTGKNKNRNQYSER